MSLANSLTLFTADDAPKELGSLLDFAPGAMIWTFPTAKGGDAAPCAREDSAWVFDQKAGKMVGHNYIAP